MVVPAITVACVQVGNYFGRGAEYVNKLAAAVRRNLSAPHDFACLTDDSAGLDARVRALPADPALLGWWQKISLFAPGRFRTERVLYFDLDTLIVGDLSAIAGYAGEFAMLEHLVRPNVPASGVMAWRNGSASVAALWNAYRLLGKLPEHSFGDQGWIADVLKSARLKPDLLQHQFRGIYSYKLRCVPRFPSDAVVSCFHAKPKPHELELSAWTL
jgi:hypothetical protein